MRTGYFIIEERKEVVSMLPLAFKDFFNFKLFKSHKINSLFILSLRPGGSDSLCQVALVRPETSKCTKQLFISSLPPLSVTLTLRGEMRAVYCI